MIVFTPNWTNIGLMTLSPVGIVRRWMRVLMRETEAESKTITSATTRGSGALGRGFRVRHAGSTTISSTFDLENTSDHAKYVFRGTHGPIFPRTGRFLAVGRSQLAHGGRPWFASPPYVRPARSVRGQKENNIPMKAVRVVFARRGMG